MEKEANLQKELELFRILISNEKDLLPSCPLEDDFLEKFLRAKDIKAESALITLKKYVKLKERIKLQNLDSVREVLESGLISILKNRDSQGRQILFYQVDLWDIQKVSAEQLYIASIFCLEQIICSVKTQQNGIVVLGNANGLSFSHCTNLGVKVIAEFVRVYQGSFPVRPKEFHILNQPKVFGIIYAIGYPLMNEKLRNRLNIHGTNLESLYKFLPREILPKSLGGALENDSAIDHELTHEILSKIDASIS